MSTNTEVIKDASDLNPLDGIEDLMVANDWVYHRLTDEELFTKLSGEHSQYNIVIQWLEKYRAMRLCCRIEQEIPEDKISEAILISSEINNGLWAGHFSVDRKDPYPAYYYTALFQNDATMRDISYLEKVMQTTLDHCERYAPLFQWISDNGQVDPQALSLLVMDQAGHA